MFRRVVLSSIFLLKVAASCMGTCRTAMQHMGGFLCSVQLNQGHKVGYIRAQAWGRKLQVKRSLQAACRTCCCTLAVA